MSTPILHEFLSGIAKILREKNGAQLQDFLAVEPELPKIYHDLASELRSNYPSDKSKALEDKCESLLPAEDSSTSTPGSWPAFISFLVQYFSFLRDVDPKQLVETHEKLKALLSSCILALSDAAMGFILLQTTIVYSRLLSKLSIGLENRPDLVASLTQRTTASTDGSGGTERLTLADSSGSTIRDGLRRCLADRGSPSFSAHTTLTGKQPGIYPLANLSLRLFIHSSNLRLAEQVFEFIATSPSSPPLAYFPAPHRVTYLYYLGRYMFSVSQFYRAFLTLSVAYAQCHAQATQQRRKIASFLLLSGLCLGRFANGMFLSRPEVAQLAGHLRGLYDACRKGDLAGLRLRLSLPHPTAESLLTFKALLQVKDQCEDICYRSLARRVFVLAGNMPSTQQQQGAAQGRAVPTFSVRDLGRVVRWCERRYEEGLVGMLKGMGREEEIDMWRAQWGEGDAGDYEDYEDDGYDEGEEIVQSVEEQNGEVTGEPNGEQNKTLNGANITDEDEEEEYFLKAESKLASLNHQGLLHGYLSRKHGRFGVSGAKNRSAVDVGFPSVWEVAKKEAEAEAKELDGPGSVAPDGRVEVKVPGWVVETTAGMGGARTNGMGGTVVNPKGARPVRQPA